MVVSRRILAHVDKKTKGCLGVPCSVFQSTLRAKGTGAKLSAWAWSGPGSRCRSGLCGRVAGVRACSSGRGVERLKLALQAPQ